MGPFANGDKARANEPEKDEEVVELGVHDG